jgi:hypothetical protein
MLDYFKKLLWEPVKKPTRSGIVVKGRFVVAKPFAIRMDGKTAVLDDGTGEGALSHLPILGLYHPGCTYHLTEKNADAVASAQTKRLCLVLPSLGDGLGMKGEAT